MVQSLTSFVPGRPWHTLTGPRWRRPWVAPDRGLDEGHVAERRSRFGANRLREAEREPAWQALRPPQRAAGR